MQIRRALIVCVAGIAAYYISNGTVKELEQWLVMYAAYNLTKGS